MSDETVRQALIEHWREEYPPDQTMLVPHFIVVAEVIDSDGDEALRIMHTENLPPWTAAGMLTGATLSTEASLNEGWEGSE